MMKEIWGLKVKWHKMEPYSPWKNQGKNAIGIIRLWDHMGSEIYSCTAGKDGHSPLKRITGDTIYILEQIDFEFWVICWYWDPAEK
jgi:hypothetical protein